jgi:glycosyltransferase involved in cell wall biosynthesis
MVRLSIILLGYKQPLEILRASIGSCFNQGYGDYEVILINNSGNPSYAELRGEYPLLKVVNTPNLPRGKARNRGVRCSVGEVIVFLDGDTIICDKHAFSRIEKYSATFTHGYGANRYWTINSKTSLEVSKKYITTIREENNFLLLCANEIILPEGFEESSGYHNLKKFTFPTNFGFVHRTIFDKIGGFCDAFKSYGGEDDYLGFLCYLDNPNGFKLLNELDVLHLTHPLGDNANNSWGPGNPSYELVQRLVKEKGYDSFNINLLFGIKENKTGEILEATKNDKNP